MLIYMCWHIKLSLRSIVTQKYYLVVLYPLELGGGLYLERPGTASKTVAPKSMWGKGEAIPVYNLKKAKNRFILLIKHDFIIKINILIFNIHGFTIFFTEIKLNCTLKILLLLKRIRYKCLKNTIDLSSSPAHRFRVGAYSSYIRYAFAPSSREKYVSHFRSKMSIIRYGPSIILHRTRCELRILRQCQL